MSQQSDSTDLLGGFQPVDVRALAEPVLDRFKTAFYKTFSRKHNATFMNKLEQAFARGKWELLVKGMQNTLKKVGRGWVLVRFNVLLSHILPPFSRWKTD